jgi:hypothetical protein
MKPCARLVLLGLLLAPGSSAFATPLHAEKPKVKSLAYEWLDIALEATALDVDRVGARPTIISRQLSIFGTALFDAWAAYDEKAVGSRLGDRLRRPRAEHTLANKRTAISHAAYRALLYAFPDQAAFVTQEMKRLGYDPADTSLDPTTPVGVGNLAAQALIDYRRRDGSNAHGDEPGSNGKPYSDYTGYQPVNTVDKIVDPDRWQPITFTLPDGKKVTPGFLTPHWFKVKPFVIDRADQFRPGPPPTTRTDDARLREETAQVLAYNASLTPRQKAEVEFMRDGPRSTAQSGHWLRFAQDVSRRDRHGLDEDVKLYFAIANVAFDAFLACWDTKRHYDSSRPWTLVRHYYAGQTIVGWAGTDGGTRTMPAEEWHPYSPQNFITPPFPGYTSGHATVSGACAKILERFTGSDHFGFKERRPCCELTERQQGAIAELDLPTFSATAEMAAVSRAMGGYHIPIDNQVGIEIGRKLADFSWPRYQAYYRGTAPVTPAALPTRLDPLPTSP